MTTVFSFHPSYSKSRLEVCSWRRVTETLSCLPNIYVSLATEPSVNRGGSMCVQLFLWGEGGCSRLRLTRSTSPGDTSTDPTEHSTSFHHREPLVCTLLKLRHCRVLHIGKSLPGFTCHQPVCRQGTVEGQELKSRAPGRTPSTLASMWPWRATGLPGAWPPAGPPPHPALTAGAPGLLYPLLPPASQQPSKGPSAWAPPANLRSRKW